MVLSPSFTTFTYNHITHYPYAIASHGNDLRRLVNHGHGFFFGLQIDKYDIWGGKQTVLRRIMNYYEWR